MAQVTLRNISKTYQGGVRAASNINIDIQDKEFVILVGPSGCGKSTILRMIAGLEDITEGDLYIDDERVNNKPPKDRNIAMVFQDYGLYPHMTVYENMTFGLRLRNIHKDEIDLRVKEAVRILGIEEYLERRPKALSGGQRQRVAVGRAIVRQPKVFLFDEPLSNLDAKLRVQMRAEISKLHHRLNATMIYVTHDQVEAMTMGDRIVVLKDGYIQQVADPLTLYNKPVNKFVAGFIGSPPMNFLKVMVIQKDDGLYCNEGNFTIKVPSDREKKLMSYINDTIIIGIRPEHIIEKGSEHDDETILQLLVEVVEPLGSEIFVYLSTSSHSIIAKVNSDHPIKVGQVFEAYFNMSKVHFFDSKTELVI